MSDSYYERVLHSKAVTFKESSLVLRTMLGTTKLRSMEPHLFTYLLTQHDIIPTYVELHEMMP